MKILGANLFVVLIIKCYIIMSKHVLYCGFYTFGRQVPKVETPTGDQARRFQLGKGYRTCFYQNNSQI